MKKWIIKYEIKSLFKIVEPLEILGVSIYLKNNVNFCEVKIEAENIDASKQLADNRIADLAAILTFSLEKSVTFLKKDAIEISENGLSKQGEAFLNTSLSVREVISEEKINQIIETTELQNKLDKTATSAIKFFNRGVEIHDWNIESFIQYFKCVELISGQFIPEFVERKKSESDKNFQLLIGELNILMSDNTKEDIIKEKIKEIYNFDFINMKIKIKYTFDKFELLEYLEKVNKIVNLRNTIAAHGSSSRNIEDEEVTLIQEISKKLITKYIDNL